MVSGERRTDLALAQASRGDWIGKAGAEGVQAVAVVSRGIGIAIKIADGQQRALAAVTVAILEQLGLIDAEARSSLAGLARPVLKNVRGIVTGQLQPAVRLVAAEPPAAPVAAAQ